MGQQENWKMTPLDSMLCSNQLQILKSLVFFFPPARQRTMIFLVKLMELRQCLTLPLFHLSSLSGKGSRSEPGQEMFEQIFPYCDHEKQQLFRQMQSAFQMMRTVQQFSDSGLFDNLSEMMGSGGLGSSFGGGGSGDSEFGNSDFGDGGSGDSDFGNMNFFANMGNLGGMMDALRQMSGMNSGGMNSFAASADTSDKAYDTDQPDSNRAFTGSTPPHDTGGDQLTSMLSSMMNPEQQALFAQYEAMLDDL